jgi:hypothetical protein
MAPEVKTAKNSKLPKLSENCLEPVGKGGWPPISIHRRHTLHRLQELEKNIKDLQIFEPIDGHDGSRQQQLKLFEAERNKILLADEALWRQRCRAKWIQCGDLNNKFFHRYASSSRNKNHIWDIVDESGTVHSGQQE